MKKEEEGWRISCSYQTALETDDETQARLDHLMALVPTLPKTGQLTLPNGNKLGFDDFMFLWEEIS